MEELLPEAYRQLIDTIRRLEEHYRDAQDIEFTIEEGKLYILQTRTPSGRPPLRCAAPSTWSRRG